MPKERTCARTTQVAMIRGLPDAEVDLRVARGIVTALERCRQPDAGRGAEESAPLARTMTIAAASAAAAEIGATRDLSLPQMARVLAEATDRPAPAAALAVVRKRAQHVRSRVEDAAPRMFHVHGRATALAFIGRLERACRRITAASTPDPERLRDLASRVDELDCLPDHLARTVRKDLVKKLAREVANAKLAFLSAIVRTSDAHTSLLSTIRQYAGQIRAASTRLDAVIDGSFAELLLHLEGSAALDAEIDESVARGALSTNADWTACFATALRCEPSDVPESLLARALELTTDRHDPQHRLLDLLQRDVDAEDLVEPVAPVCRSAARELEGTILQNVRGSERELLVRLLKRTRARPRLAPRSKALTNVGLLLPEPGEGERAAHEALRQTALDLRIPSLNIGTHAGQEIVVFRVHYAWAPGENVDLREVVRRHRRREGDLEPVASMVTVGKWFDAPWITDEPAEDEEADDEAQRLDAAEFTIGDGAHGDAGPSRIAPGSQVRACRREEGRERVLEGPDANGSASGVR